MPRRIIGAAFVSLDNVMQAPGGPDEDRRDGFPFGGWFAAVAEEAIGTQIDTVFTAPFDLLLGRRTYEIFAAHWPFMPMEPGSIAQRFEACSKFVLTRSDLALEWRGSHRLADLDALVALKDTDEPSLVIQGSTTLYPQLLKRGLIDRLVLIRVPILLGQGRTIFPEGTPPLRLRPVETRITPGGAVLSTFDLAGEVETSAFEMPEPSSLELQRRQRIAQGTW